MADQLDLFSSSDPSPALTPGPAPTPAPTPPPAAVAGLEIAAAPDQTDRDLVTGALGTTLFVEAGAGSGKTTALVRRVVNLILSGVPVGRIAAITFTEKAAAELRDRVRVALANASEGRPVDNVTNDPRGSTLPGTHRTTMPWACTSFLTGAIRSTPR